MAKSLPLLEFLLAFAGVTVLLPFLIRVAPRLGLIDRPDARKRHRLETPLVGGLALFAGLAVVLTAMRRDDDPPWALLIGGAMVVLAGLADDRRGLSTATRFLVQTVACMVMVFGAGVVLRDFGELLWPATLELGVFGVPITLFCVVGVTNAINMIDGMDGLSGSIALVTVAGLLAAMGVAGQPVGSAPEMLALAGALCAFLLSNLRLPGRAHASAFLGDGGTLLLGFMLGWMLVEHSQGASRVIAPVTALWLLAVPLMDTVFIMIKRRQSGKSMVAADREHLHHAFLRSGRGVNRTLATLVGIAGLLASLGLALQWSGVPEYLSYALFLLACWVYYAGMSRAWRRRTFLGRPIT